MTRRGAGLGYECTADDLRNEMFRDFQALFVD